MAAFLVPCRSRPVRRQGALETLIPEGHLARFIWQVLSRLDFSGLEAGYRSVHEGPGRPPYHPRVLAALWIYGMTQGLETAAMISTSCTLRDDFRWLAGDLHPSDQTLLNFLAQGEALASIWVQVLQAMHRAGHIDLSAIAEDGTKLRANASPRSFHTAAEIDQVIEQLKGCIAEKVKALAAEAGEAPQQPKARAEFQSLQRRLVRAERAAQELRERADRRSRRKEVEAPNPDEPTSQSLRAAPLFGPADFRRDAERDLMICPVGEELRCIGTYPTDNGRGTYRLYGRRDCSGCSLKIQCTRGQGRRLKIPVQARSTTADATVTGSESGSTTNSSTEGTRDGKDGKDQPAEPRASLTDPEAVLMLATSEKRWQPSYNADLAVTRHQVIVSQFLTKHPTDFPNFDPALGAVLSTLERPESWIGDGHYGTQANLLLAHQKGVVLYAPTAGGGKGTADEPSMTAAIPGDAALQSSAAKRFSRENFLYQAEGDMMLCPAGEALGWIGTYPNPGGRGSYRLYGRRDCTGCLLKDQCTCGRGRRVKVPVAHTTPIVEARDVELATQEDASVEALVEGLERRMQDIGDQVLKFRRQTVEPVHAQIKQHGVGRFHVRGLRRCAVVLTLACIAHNLMKWKARETTLAMRLQALAA